MNTEGWIKLHRKILNNPLFHKSEVLHYFVYCLLKANHEHTSIIWNNRETTIECGCFITGLKKTSQETGLSIRKIRTAQKILDNLGIIEKSPTKSTNKFTYLRVCNYENYQSKKLLSDNQNDNQTTSKRQQTIINKNKEKYPLHPPKGDGGCVLSSGDEVEVLQRMEKFWNAYPRKQGKEKLKDVWKEMSPSGSLLETMLKAIEIQKKSSGWKRESGRFIPSPSKWLNERRWEDVVKTEQPSPAPEMKRETCTPEDRKRFDQAWEKGMLDCKKILGMGGERNANSGN